MSNPMTSLISVMKQLRDPKSGCPWDIKQTFETIAPYTIEEAYEVEDAIRSGDIAAIKEELGDLLLQVVFHAQIATEAGYFTFDDIAQTIHDKMIRRHPHVFSDKESTTPEAVQRSWDDIKKQERDAKQYHKNNRPYSILNDLTTNLPALILSQKIQNRVAKVGFDWPDTSHVIDKISEESRELQEAVIKKESDERISEEYGDLLFVIANLGRHYKIDSETALRNANAKFIRRFQAIEEKLVKQGKDIEACNLQDLDALWDQVKLDEKQ